MGPLIFSISIRNGFPSIKDHVVEVLWDGALIMVMKEVADIWCIAVSILEDVYDDSFVVSYLRRDGNKGNWSMS